MIYCPTCSESLRLPPQLEMLKTIHQGGGSYMASGDPDQILPCPHCRTGLLIRDILDGKYDNAKFTWKSFLSFLVTIGLIAGGIALWRSC